MKIFKNLFGNNSKIDFSNIATVEDNKSVELSDRLTGTVLYENDDLTRSSETITLSDSAENYNLFEIYYYETNYNKAYMFTKIFSPNNKSVSLNYVYVNDADTGAYIGASKFTISENTIIFSIGRGMQTCGDGYGTGGNFVIITKVIGYK